MPEETLYGIKANFRAILEHLLPDSYITFYGEFIKIQSKHNIKNRLKIEGLNFKKE